MKSPVFLLWISATHSKFHNCFETKKKEEPNVPATLSYGCAGCMLLCVSTLTLDLRAITSKQGRRALNSGCLQAPITNGRQEEDSQICRSCQQQFWGLSASSLSPAEHLEVAQTFRALMPSKLFPPLLHEEKYDARVKRRSTEWMQDKLKGCLLED